LEIYAGARCKTGPHIRRFLFRYAPIGFALKLSKNPFKLLYAVWFGLWTVIIFLVLYPLIRYNLATPERYPAGHRMRRIWGWLLLRVGFIRVKQVLEQPIDASKPYIITPNHTSQLDIVTLTVKLNQLDFSFMAKVELEHIPVFGIWFRTIDIAVDRKNPRKAAEAYMKAAKFFDSGRSLVMFPEGTISKEVPRLISFKDGPFRLAIERQVDVLPVTIINNWKILPDRGVFEGRPGTCLQYIHAPISTKGLTLADIPALKSQVYNVINAKLKEHGY
jgi:1-acyl-sn-glycerol-3-phosphate acyltransferase